MPQLPRLSVCPSCDEPLEPGDNFCGACGADLATADPTTGGGAPALSYPAPGAPWTAGGEPPAGPSAGWPAADPSGPGAHRPDDLLTTDSADPGAAAPGGAPGGAESGLQPATGDCVACRAGRVDRDGYCEHCGHAQPRERDHMEQELAGVAAVTDRGLRHHRNEDAFSIATAALPDGSPAVLAVVCDGVSSASRPDEASEAAAGAATESLLSAVSRGVAAEPATHEAIVAAAQAVNQLAETGPSPGPEQQNAPACTIVTAVLASGVLTVGWIGDSRAYWVPDDRAAQSARLTEDDSWAAQMVAGGLLSEAEAYADDRAHAITGWLGADAYELQPHTASFTPDRPGVVVVCTDGLWNYAEAAGEMALAVPPESRNRPLHGAQALVGYALDGGGHDNVTVAVLPVPEPPSRAVSA
ncbi:PP2C family serine/threonine-protein phosphatase [Streptomyces sp. TP-A0874]|uniref:PP2C family serine/threonine-protein phosphatase n=1 Tax=Streptomyces sp. TP-A0874 TaxID=549819 RepID=UPI0008536584|nr:PP2C family serine/threonine-protein phosphatase [Streptomyces sp. TP-A0874]